MATWSRKALSTWGLGWGMVEQRGWPEEMWTWNSLPPSRNYEREAPCELGRQCREMLLSILRTLGNHRKLLSSRVT